MSYDDTNLHKALETLCARFGLPIPRLEVQANSRREGWFNYKKNVIHLGEPQMSSSLDTLLHEFAHCLQAHRAHRLAKYGGGRWKALGWEPYRDRVVYRMHGEVFSRTLVEVARSWYGDGEAHLYAWGREMPNTARCAAAAGVLTKKQLQKALEGF